jgi:hypothetical protein
MAGILAPRSPVFSPTVDCLQSLVVGKTESSSTADDCGSKLGELLLSGRRHLEFPFLFTTS